MGFYLALEGDYLPLDSSSKLLLLRHLWQVYQGVVGGGLRGRPGTTAVVEIAVLGTVAGATGTILLCLQ